MNCEDAQNLVDGYVDGELDMVRTLEIEEHLRGCALCSQGYQDRQILHDGIKAHSGYFKAPADLQTRIQLSLRKAAKAESPSRRLPWQWLKVAAPMAAAAIVVLMLVPFLRSPRVEDTLTRELISSHVRSLMANHLADVSSSDKHTVKPWFNGKLDFSPPVENLVEQGFPLVGGRLDYLDNRPVAALVYQRKKHFINVFIWPSTQSSEIGTKPVTLQGYRLFQWARSGMTFWAVSDLEESELQEFVRLLQKQVPSASNK
jgi:anti-sigma factor RsiW